MIVGLSEAIETDKAKSWGSIRMPYALATQMSSADPRYLHSSLLSKKHYAMSKKRSYLAMEDVHKLETESLELHPIPSEPLASNATFYPRFSMIVLPKKIRF